MPSQKQTNVTKIEILLARFQFIGSLRFVPPGTPGLTPVEMTAGGSGCKREFHRYKSCVDNTLRTFRVVW